MASGWSHAKVNLVGAAILLGLAYALDWPNQEVLGVGLGCFASTMFLSPDVDLRQSISSRSWGILRFIWIPYHRIFRHRRMSHWPVLGTLTRLIYLIVVTELLWFVVLTLKLFSQEGQFMEAMKDASSLTHQVKQMMITFIQDQERSFLAFFIGLVIGDVLHVITDWLTSLRRTYFQRK